MTEPVALGPRPIKIMSDHGEESEYRFHPWPASHGIYIARNLAPIIEGLLESGGPLVAAYKKSPLKSMSLADSKDDLLDKVGQVLAAMGPGLGQLATKVAVALDKAGDSDLIKDILVGAHRVNKAKPGEGVIFSFETGQAFDRVYAGNYGEMLVATAEALKANFAPTLDRLKNDPSAAEGQRQTATHKKEPKRRHR